MDQQEKPKRNNKGKQSVPLRHVRVTPETLRSLQKLVSQANKKEFGKRILANDVVSMALVLVKDRHIEMLQDASLSNKDRFDQQYADYCKQHGKVSRDEFLGRLMRGELHQSFPENESMNGSADVHQTP